jgi:hypothetical protein
VRRLLPPPALNFAAGLFAGAGINLLTSVATAPPGTAANGIVVDSAMWVAAAAAATWLGQTESRIDDEVADRVTSKFSVHERNEVRADVRAERLFRVRLWLATVTTGSTLLLSLLLVPRIGPLSW